MFECGVSESAVFRYLDVCAAPGIYISKQMHVRVAQTIEYDDQDWGMD